MKKPLPNKAQAIAINAVRRTTIPDNIKVRVNEKAIDSLLEFDLDTMLAHLQYIPSNMLIDLVSYRQITPASLGQTGDLDRRLSLLYNGNTDDGRLDPSIDHRTALRSLVEHYTTYRKGDVVSLLAVQTHIGVMSSNDNMTAVQHNFNLAQLVVDDLAANLGSLVQTAGDKAYFETQANRISSTYTNLIRNLKTALSVAEAANAVAVSVITTITTTTKEHGCYGAEKQDEPK